MNFSHDDIAYLVRLNQFDFKACAHTLNQLCHGNISPDQLRLAFANKESIQVDTDTDTDTNTKEQSINYTNANLKSISYDEQPLNNAEDYENIIKSMEINHQTRRANVFAKVSSSFYHSNNDYNAIMHSLPANIRIAIQVSFHFIQMSNV